MIMYLKLHLLTQAWFLTFFFPYVHMIYDFRHLMGSVIYHGFNESYPPQSVKNIQLQFHTSLQILVFTSQSKWSDIISLQHLQSILLLKFLGEKKKKRPKPSCFKRLYPRVLNACKHVCMCVCEHLLIFFSLFLSFFFFVSSFHSSI